MKRIIDFFDYWAYERPASGFLILCTVTIILCVLAPSCDAGLLTSKETTQQKIDSLQKEILKLQSTIKNNVTIVSKIETVTPDYSHMPSYCTPQSYTILKLNNKYAVRLPGGTIMGERYNTPEEAQIDINERAALSKKTWIESLGTDF